MKSNFNFKISKEIREFCQHERGTGWGPKNAIFTSKIDFQNLGCPKLSSWGGIVTFTTFCKKPEGAISFTFGVRPQPVGFPGGDLDSRCQSFTARRGPVVHSADLVKCGCENHY